MKCYKLCTKRQTGVGITFIHGEYFLHSLLVFFLVCSFTIEVQAIACILCIRATVLDANHSPLGSVFILQIEASGLMYSYSAARTGSIFNL